MAKKIKDIHDLVDLLTKKGRTGYYSRDEIDLAIYTASKDLFDAYYRVYEMNRRISDSMSVFLSDPTTATLNGSGQWTYPVDFIHEVNITAGTSGKVVMEVDQSQAALKINNPLVPPTADYPVFVAYATYLQFYPTTLTGVKVTYLKPPVRPVYAVTISSGREVYDDANSVDVEWNLTDISKVTMRTLSALGVSLEDMNLTQWSEMKEKDNE